MLFFSCCTYYWYGNHVLPTQYYIYSFSLFLFSFTEDLGEVRSLVVDDAFKRQGLGRMLVQRITEEARTIGLRRLMALTYLASFFHKLGFKTVAIDTLPEKVWGICVKCYKFNNCDETAVVLELR